MAIPVIKLLNNHFLRFLVCLVSGTNLMLFLYTYDFVCAGIFMIAAIVASFYSKYMVVILIVAMVICNLICVSSNRVEGFKKKPGFKKPGFMKPKNKSKPKPAEGSDDDNDDKQTTDETPNNKTNSSESDTATTETDGDNPTMAQNIATILSMLKTVKKELTE